MDYDIADIIPPNRNTRFMAVAENAVLDEISQERHRQHEMWGEQNWPIFFFQNEEKSKAVERECKGICESAAKAGIISWDCILDEEVAEAYAGNDPEHIREELIHVAAVCVAMIRCIDRNKNNPAWRVVACSPKKE